MHLNFGIANFPDELAMQKVWKEFAVHLVFQEFAAFEGKRPKIQHEGGNWEMI